MNSASAFRVVDSLTAGTSQRGVAIIELAIALPALLALFTAMLDLSLLFRERMVVLEAAEIAGRVVATTPDYQYVANAGYSDEDQRTMYATLRFQRAINAAKSVIFNSGLDPNFYSYRISSVTRTNAASGAASPAARVRINSRDDASRFIIIPSAFNNSKICLEVTTFVYGLMRAENDPYYDPDIDNSCDPPPAS